ncbi:MAG TPA: hypothetical protein VFD84_01625 [Candidatus Binatia bacterium]|nr:hypothetical protein [Candidatus Binatia bacterium]
MREAGQRGTEELRQAGEKVIGAGQAGARQLRQAGEHVVEAGQAGVEQLREAGTKVASAGEAGADLAREVAGAAGERLEQAAIGAGRTAVEIGVHLMSLPELAREAARRSVELVEEAGTKAVATVLHTGSRVLEVAADYMTELTPRRRVNRAALERLVTEQIAWAQAGTNLYDRTIGDLPDDGTRVRLVRCKLQMIRQVETLTMLMRRIGGTMPSEERLRAVHPVALDGGQPEGPRQRVAQAFSIASQSAEGWRALARIAGQAESDQVAEAISQATESIGREPEEQVEFLRDVFTRVTVDAVLA